ncbi:MAG: HIT family protein [Candidatus Falkowbacteria bacterium]
MNKDCIFCKIVAGEIPCDKIYEDDKILAFLDIKPSNNGHTLLISKEHYKNTTETPTELLEYMIIMLKKIAPAIIKGAGAEGWNLIVNNGAVAGQIIFHTHWHIIPRFENDGHKFWGAKTYGEGEEKKITEEIKNNL